MKVGNIVESNIKGQIVIPKKIRDDLGISPGTALNVVVRDDGIYLYPIISVVTTEESEISHKAYIDLLKATQGILASKPYYKNEKAKIKLERESSLRRKKAWW